MAPSRSLFRTMTGFAPSQLRPTPSVFFTHASRTSRHRAVLNLKRFPIQFSGFPKLFTRGLSQPASTAPQPPDYLNEAELHVFNKIKAELKPVKLEVQDISGGCGSMYALEIESPIFRGLTVIKQHKMVNAILKDEIKSWHGVQLRTKAT